MEIIWSIFLQQDPLSHRIIEKRRRDRMNSCLADLSRLIPPQYQRKGRGRIEKTEIIEMAIRHIKSFQKQENVCRDRDTILADRYRRGYNDCLTEAAKFLVAINDDDTICYKMIEHLKEHCGEIMKSKLIFFLWWLFCVKFCSLWTSSNFETNFLLWVLEIAY